MSRARALVGTSGWQHEHWKGLFYPSSMPKSQWFHYYAGRFATVEVNNTFYRLPSAEAFDTWREQALPGFVYALKYSRYGTHLKRLLEPQAHLKPFLERARRLGPRLGPILVQLPPTMGPNLPRLEAFLSAASRDLRWAVEFRHAGWLMESTLHVLRRHNAALVVHDKLPGHLSDQPDGATASFVYYRFHGGGFDGGYDPATLARWAGRMAAHAAAGRQVYAYFNNDLGGHAVHDARTLVRLLSDLNVRTGGKPAHARGAASAESPWHARPMPSVRPGRGQP